MSVLIDRVTNNTGSRAWFACAHGQDEVLVLKDTSKGVLGVRVQDTATPPGLGDTPFPFPTGRRVISIRNVSTLFTYVLLDPDGSFVFWGGDNNEFVQFIA